MPVGISFSLSVGIMVDDNLNSAFYESHTSLPPISDTHEGDRPFSGVSIPVTNATTSITGVGYFNPKADTIEDVKGRGLDYGITMGRGSRAITIAYTPSLDKDGTIASDGYTVGLGAGEGIGLHGAHTYTNLVGRNLPQRAYNAADRAYSEFEDQVERTVRDYAGVPR
jgi:hypothetical protein